MHEFDFNLIHLIKPNESRFTINAEWTNSKRHHIQFEYSKYAFIWHVDNMNFVLIWNIVNDSENIKLNSRINNEIIIYELVQLTTRGE